MKKIIRAYVTIKHDKENYNELKHAQKVLKTKRIFVSELIDDDYTVFATREISKKICVQIVKDFTNDTYNTLIDENEKHGLNINMLVEEEEYQKRIRQEK